MDYKKIQTELETNLIKNRFRCSTSIYNPIEWHKVIISIILKILDKHPNKKILIVNSNYTLKHEIVADVTKVNPNYLTNVVYISPKYADAFVKNFYFIIAVDAGLETIDYINQYNKFGIYINTNSKINITEFTKIKSSLPYFNLDLSISDAIKSSIQSPVKEWRHEVGMIDEDKDNYTKCSEFVSDSMKIFNDMYTLECCRMGDKKNNLSAMDCCCNIAYNNGWSRDIDTSTEFGLQIDKYYNPNAISERATLVYNIIRNRRNIVLNNTLKYDIILKLCEQNRDKKILIVSKNGDFANNIAEHLQTNSINVGMFHNEIPASYMYDGNGNVITYKSGENKGKAKLFKDVALSRNYKDMFNANLLNVLVIKECSDNSLDIDVDMIIYASSLVTNIFDFKTRYQHIRYRTKETILHRIYTKDTIEEQILYKEPQNSLVCVQNGISESNIQFNNESGEINID